MDVGVGVQCRQDALRVPAIGKKADFPIEFIRLTSIDSLRAGYGQDKWRISPPRSRNERIPLQSGKHRELPVTASSVSMVGTFCRYMKLFQFASFLVRRTVSLVPRICILFPSF